MLDLQQRLNAIDLEKLYFEVHHIDEYCAGVRNSFERHSNPREQYTGLRLSQIGKPAVLQALWGLGFPHDGGIALRQRLIFHTGDWFESLLILLLRAAGYEIVDWNNNNIYHGMDPVTGDKYIEFMGVRGHSDIIVYDPVTSTQFVVEAKTANARYFNTFLKKPDDERGYISQLALYTHVLDMPGIWVFYNKNTSEIVTQVLTPEVRNQYIDRATAIIPVLQEIKTWGHLVSALQDGKIQVPPPVEEVYRRSKTGLYLVPPSMKYTKYRHCFYEIVVDNNGYNKPTEYVVQVYDRPQLPESIDGDTLDDTEAT